MGYFDYSKEPRSDIAFVDMKSFYASVECVERGLHPLKTSLCVMSRADNSAGLILASSPMFKKIFGKSNVGRSYDLPFDIKTRRFSYYNAKKQGLPTDSEYVRYIEEWAKVTFIVPPRMDAVSYTHLDVYKRQLNSSIIRRLRVTSSFGREMEVTLRSYDSEKYFSYLLTFRGEIWYHSRRYCLPHLKGPGTFQILFDGKEHPSP